MTFKRTLAIGAALLILYISSFLAYRALPYTFDLVPPGEPGHYLVIFSFNTNLHCAARTIYAPLIATIPGKRYYPVRHEHKLIMDDFERRRSEAWEASEEE
ncbi:MAG: hypothetical protein ACKVP0_28260 [Pirellulaceae bacterium]